MPMKFPKLFKRVELVDVSDPFDVGDIGHAIMDDGRVQIIGKERALSVARGQQSGRPAAEQTQRARQSDVGRG